MKYALPIVIIVLALLGANSIYVVGEGHAASLSRFGRVETSGIGPGLHLKLPFVQDVSVYDTREIISQAEPGDCKTRDGHSVRVGFHVRWQIAEPATYFNATSGDELQATQQMEPLIRNALRSEVADNDLSALLAATSQGMGAKVRGDIAAELRAKLGIDVLGVGIGRVLPREDALASVYKRMTAEAQAAAGTVRAQSEAETAAIHAQGDADNEQVLAAASQAAAAMPTRPESTRRPPRQTRSSSATVAASMRGAPASAAAARSSCSTRVRPSCRPWMRAPRTTTRHRQSNTDGTDTERYCCSTPGTVGTT